MMKSVGSVLLFFLFLLTFAPTVMAQSTMLQEAELADQIGLLYRQGDFRSVENVLEKEYGKTRRASPRDLVREVLILHELADLALRRNFNFERASKYIQLAQGVLDERDLVAAYQKGSPYKDIRRSVSNRLTAFFSDYVLVFRALPLDQLKASVQTLAFDVARVIQQRDTTGSAKSDQQDTSDVRAFIAELKENLTSTSGRTEKGQILSRLALLNFRIGNAQEGNRYFSQLLDYTQQTIREPRIGDWNPLLPPQLQVELFHLNALAHKRAGDDATALALWEWAIAVYETFRTTIQSEENRIEIFANLGSLYASALDAALAVNQGSKVALLAERSKSRALADALRGRSTFLKKEHTGLLRQFEADSANGIEKSGKRNASVIDNVEPEVANLMTYSESFLPGEDVIDVVRSKQKDAAVVMYFETASGLGVAVISQRGVFAKRLSAAKTEIESDAKRLFKQGTDRIIFTSDKVALNRLHRSLIKPILDKLADARHIVFLPFGLLQNIPFNALYDGKQFLIERWSISTTPSLSALAVLLKKAPSDQARALLVGNPDYSGRLPQLQFAEVEAKTIPTEWPDSTVLTGRQATETEIKRLAGEYGILHFATHGKFVASNPLKSFVMLSTDSSNDGFLEAQEIFSMNLQRTSLVILSACESSVAKVRLGDELIGFFRAFAYAGVPSLIAAQWEVDDRATKDLMVGFYREVRADATFGNALRTSQLALLKEGRPVDQWAPFQLTGNPFLKLGVR